MSRILTRPLAQRDLAELWSFIADDSQDQADRFLDGLQASLLLWSTQPQMGRKRDELMAGLRSMSHGRYVIFAFALADGIEVVRVLHSARDIGADEFAAGEGG